MKLSEALAKSSIATLETDIGRYYATVMRVYFEDQTTGISKQQNLIQVTKVLISNKWEAMGDEV